MAVLECVINVSTALDEAWGDDVLDVHADPWHGRSVVTVVGEDAARRVASLAVSRIDLRRHSGVHPRVGAVDVVPFVPLAGSTMADAIAARDRFASWVTEELGVPALVYGPDGPSLPVVRRSPPPFPHPTAGACCVGARPVLVAYNVVVDRPLADAHRLAASLRSPAVRALAFPVGDDVQVSMNLLDPLVVGPAEVYDAIGGRGRAELVGLVPEAVLDGIPEVRWAELDLAPERTIEARLRRAGPGTSGARP
jgi:glutamate formiminotransferase